MNRLLAICLLALSTGSFAEQRTITVAGEGTVASAPTVAIIRAGVATQTEIIASETH